MELKQMSLCRTILDIVAKIHITNTHRDAISPHTVLIFVTVNYLFDLFTEVQWLIYRFKLVDFFWSSLFCKWSKWVSVEQYDGR